MGGKEEERSYARDAREEKEKMGSRADGELAGLNERDEAWSVKTVQGCAEEGEEVKSGVGGGQVGLRG